MRVLFVFLTGLVAVAAAVGDVTSLQIGIKVRERGEAIKKKKKSASPFQKLQGGAAPTPARDKSALMGCHIIVPTIPCGAGRGRERSHTNTHTSPSQTQTTHSPQSKPADCTVKAKAGDKISVHYTVSRVGREG